jgi:hypothetical protein
MVVQDISLQRACEPSANTSCEACGQAFTCGATLAGCWCAELKLTEAVRALLRTRFQSCLCRACLERFARERGANDAREET